MFDEKLDDHRIRGPDAAPEDNPEPDALRDAASRAGRGTRPRISEREGVAGPPGGTTDGDDAVGIV
jgi:hypothetical protein